MLFGEQAANQAPKGQADHGERDADGKHVPLMHTGKNGAYVGQLKMRLEKE